ncbi:phosphate signaling complex protein PhoU [Hyphomonas sp. WL0036]|uniref:phosphate signaling complex protein PhoU n=1 Tax=Hyphomonas sediminis TaxID=2866160 RepID=UPI001C81788D|nr:phosphate signaling complex protein PhoU [Hyphomonas sediminis]MBY9067848.1 phosphate signaling complex protein PhoU [Hyphomonas sediminis]
MSDHIVSAYSDELDRLSSDIMRMGGIVETMITDSCRSLSANDPILSKEVIARDPQVDVIEAEIEKQIVSLIARRQPMGHDLRMILSALKISNEMERIGDLSKNIAKRSLRLDDHVSMEMRNAVLRMSRPVARQLNEVLDAYATGNSVLARNVWASDDDIDQHYNAVFREMLTYLIEDPRRITAGAHMLFIAKNLERMGDHCTNIAEFVYYQATGDYLSATDRPKLDQV